MKSDWTLEHIGIAVKNLDDASLLYQSLLGVPAIQREHVSDQKVTVSFFKTQNVNIELLEATDPTSPIAKFIQKNEKGGIHHLCFTVPDIREALVDLKAKGFQLIDEEPRLGAHDCWVAFIHPKSTSGVLIEISQKIVP